MRAWAAAAAACLACLVLSSALCADAYLPGVAPVPFKRGKEVPLKVNKLDSVKTQLPYDYYSLPFCRPSRIYEQNENLGEVLAGDRIESSLYQIHMRMTQACKILCRATYTDAQLRQFADRVEEEYRVNWIVDNLPAATKFYTAAPGAEDLPASGPTGDNDTRFVAHYEKGFELGFVGSREMPNTVPGVKYINNHVRLVLYFHEDVTSFEGNRIVGFEVEPFSVLHKVDGEWRDQDTRLKTCTSLTPVMHGMTPQPVSGKLSADEKTIIWTYDVSWNPSSVKWASRWDIYLKMTDSQIHWFSIVNSTMIVLFLTGMIAMIMMRTLHRDLLAYNEEQSAEEQIEETGWKLLHGDVFRPPAHGGLFSVLVGSGVQVFGMTTATLSLAVLGFLSPANRGSVMTALLLLFVFMGVFAGYHSTRMFKTFKLTEWKRNTFWTAVFFPGICFGVFFVLNLLVWGEESSGAVPFGTLVALLVLWFGISVPLVYVGSYFAFKRPVEAPPVAVNHIPRMVPEQAWYMQPHFSVLVGGVLPFGAVFIEIFFIMSSVWLHQFYYVFGFLFIVFVILIVTCAEITIVMCYFQLCGEDYHWWWRSFFTSGSSALYLFAYSGLYFATKLEVVKLVPALLYFGYMFLVSFAFFLLTGTIGFFAAHRFVTLIYGAIKID